MLESNKQTIGDNNSGTVNQINGNNVNVGLSYTEVESLCNHVIASKMQALQEEARRAATIQVAETSNLLHSRINNLESALYSQFAKPEVQFALRDTLEGVLRNPTKEVQENMVDLLIERIKEERRTSKQMLINDALKILPKLSKESLDALTLLTFRNLNRKGTATDLISWFKCMNPLLDGLSSITSFDISYLLQADCVTGGLNSIMSKDWAELCIVEYDLFFRHNPDPRSYAGFCKKYGINYTDNGITLPAFGGDQNKIALFLQLFELRPEDPTYFKPRLVNMNHLSNVMTNNGMGDVYGDVSGLILYSTPYTKSEVEAYLRSLNPNWNLALKIMRNYPMTSFQMKPVGAYIGSRQLSKLTGEDIPIDVFYL